MYYAVTHLTVYEYSEPITDSVMEIRKQPRNGDHQRCLRFELDVSPSVRIAKYRDYLGNTVHHFDIPAPHTKLAVKSNAVVELTEPPTLPNALDGSAWDSLDAIADDYEYLDMLMPGKYTHMTDLLKQFANEIGFGRTADPLTVMRHLNGAIYHAFEYRQNVTRVDSPIDEALEIRRGVCQDFTHIMLTLARSIGIPSRYVSGYLFHRSEQDRSDVDASHAWVEAWFPELGWVGFDPTNNIMARERHVRVCVATDYAEASPSRGVFKGIAETTLGVQVEVTELEAVPREETPIAPEIVLPTYTYYQQQQQQQQ
ncbi:MAG: transglutaminase family protein [Chloroflexota bacterium]